MRYAWIKSKIAEEQGKEYDPLQDEVAYLRPQDFDRYYDDMLNAAKKGEDVSMFPYYDEAVKKHPKIAEYVKMSTMTLEEFFAPCEPIVNTEKKIGRNDPCPCGSGKKYKKCCGMNR